MSNEEIRKGYLAWTLGLVIALVATLPGTSGAQAAPAKTILERLCQSEKVPADLFAPSLGRNVETLVEEILADFKETLGACREVVERADHYVMVFERGSVVATIRLNQDGRIEALLLRPRFSFSGLEAASSALRGLAGRVGALVTENGRELLAVETDTPLAVGSAFKLTVLAALKEEIAAGRRSWDHMVMLRPEWKSLPSGILQEAPDYSQHSVQRLASLMISISDNTATDALIHLIGRERIEAIAPPRNRPFLTTREAFILKAPSNTDLLDRYRRGDGVARRKVLEEVGRRPLPGFQSVAGWSWWEIPRALDVEWFYTLRELCALISRVADLPLTGINPGFALRSDWTRVAFKGGSEPGVLNLTSLLESKRGKTHCVAATWNNERRSNTTPFLAIYGGILDLLK